MVLERLRGRGRGSGESVGLGVGLWRPIWGVCSEVGDGVWMQGVPR